MYQFVDTYDHYNTAFLDALSMYEYVSGAPLISSSYARFAALGSYPNQGIYTPSSAACRKNLLSNQPRLIAFRSFGAAALPSGSAPASILVFFDAGTAQCFLGLNGNGSVQFYTGTPGYTPVAIGPASAAGLISPSTVPTHGIEVDVTFSATVGSVQCWLDGALVIPQTSGLNTIKTAHAYANQIGWGAFSLSSNPVGDYSDYLRVWDATGSYQNAPLGYDVRKLTKLPQGAGAETGWTPSAGANWQCVDDATPDGDATYVSSTTPGTADAYSMGTGLNSAPSMTVAKSYARKDDGATRTLQNGVMDTGGSNSLGTAATMSSGYSWVSACISVDPATGLPPTAAAADAFQHLKSEAS